MNVGSHYTLSADGHVLETRSDASCIQWVGERRPECDASSS